MKLLGTSYSHTFAASLGLQDSQYFNQLISLDFNIIRLCCYWDEIQSKPDIFNYSAIKLLLDMCEKNKQNVILTVGMKAPRWPEFYIPSWIQTKDLNEVGKYTEEFIEKTIQQLKHYQCIQYWQIENEPLDPSGPHRQTVPFDVLKNEVDLVKRLDPKRDIILTLWGNELTRRNHVNKLSVIADHIGIDLYYKQFLLKVFGRSIYKGPDDSEKTLQEIIANSPKSIWITELQAEPWEADTISYKSENCKSMNLSILKKNIERAMRLNPQAILLWGSEYWLWKLKQGKNDEWKKFCEIVHTLH